MIRIVLFCFLLGPQYLLAGGVSNTDSSSITGKWISERKNIIVKIYPDGRQFKAKVVWFNDSDDLQRPMATRTDDFNPDPAFRKRRIIGMDIMKGLTYDRNSSSWENGNIYDARTGKEWSACANLSEDGLLIIKGYWHFKFISKSVKFSRLN